MEIENRKTIYISYKATAGSACETLINLDDIDFKPDIVIFKNPYYNNNGAEAGVLSVYFGLVNSNIFIVSDTQNASYSEITYKLSGVISGSYKLQLLDYLTGLIAANRQGRISLTLEFIKYK